MNREDGFVLDTKVIMTKISETGIFEERQEKLQTFINQLPEQQQKIFTLHKLENLSYKEIAALTDLSEKTIANHIYLASKFIRKKVENH